MEAVILTDDYQQWIGGLATGDAEHAPFHNRRRALVVRGIVTADTFWKAAHNLCEFMKPIFDLIGFVDADNPMMHRMGFEFAALKRHFEGFSYPTDAAKTETMKLVDKYVKACESSIIVVGRVLSVEPELAGKDRNDVAFSQARNEAYMLLKKWFGDNRRMSAQLLSFFNNAASFTKQAIDLNRNTIEFWARDTAGLEYVDLSVFARMVYAQAVSACAAERYWSLAGLVHTKLRNRMTFPHFNQIVQTKLELSKRENWETGRPKRHHRMLLWGKSAKEEMPSPDEVAAEGDSSTGVWELPDAEEWEEGDGEDEESDGEWDE